MAIVDVVIVVALVGWGGDLSVADIESRALAGRRAIKTGDFEVATELVILEDGEWKPENSFEYRIWLDGSRLRCDQVIRTHRYPDPIRTVTGIHVEDGNRSILWSDYDHNSTLGQLFESVEMGLANLEPTLIDPRLLGLAPTGFAELVDCQMESYLRNPDRVDERLERTAHGDLTGWAVSWRKKDGSRIETTIVPDMGFSVVRMALSFQSPDGKTQREWIELEPKLHAESGVWFPATFVARRSTDDVEHFKQFGKVVVHSINRTLDPNPFLLASMQLPSRTWFVTSDGGRAIWLGDRLEIMEGAPARERAERIKASQQSRWTWPQVLLASNAAIFALLAIILVARAWRRAA